MNFKFYTKRNSKNIYKTVYRQYGNSIFFRTVDSKNWCQIMSNSTIYKDITYGELKHVKEITYDNAIEILFNNI